jgi:hypothetical protein
MKFRKCPFCKKKPKTGFPSMMYLETFGKWSFTHHCSDKLMVHISADSKEQIEKIWNGGAKNE